MINSCNHCIEFKSDAEVDDQIKSALQTAATEAKALLVKHSASFPPALYICTILDPRWNIHLFQAISSGNGIDCEFAKQHIREVYNMYYSTAKTKATDTSSSSTPKTGYVRSRTSIFNPVKQDGTSLVCPKDDLDLYLSLIPCDPTTDPLKWWSSKRVIYPSVAKMARDYLSIPGTSVCWERSFSDAVYTFPHHRVSVDSDNLIFAHCLKNWYTTFPKLKIKF
ncbi:hypothetical protein MP638_004786 [Amoeboaphelidium occidentale]|nr:hypothetical protein MP638_004786 [Amoeboaphelidium occidentale]